MTLEPSMWATLAILAYVTLQRLLELVVANRNTSRLKARGAVEVAARHYPLIVATHATWLAALWFLCFGQPISVPLLIGFAGLQGLRFWTLLTLGRRWTTRIIVLPGETLVAAGPYRFVRHPNYLVVVLEIALLPSVFGLYGVALLFTALNALVLAVRIPAEAKALREFSGR